MLTTEELETHIKTIADGYTMLYEEITGELYTQKNPETIKKSIDICLHTLFDWEHINRYQNRFIKPVGEHINPILIDRKNLSKPYAACLWLRYGLSGNGIYNYTSIMQFVNFNRLWAYTKRNADNKNCMKFDTYGRIRGYDVTMKNWINKSIKLLRHPVYINILQNKSPEEIELINVINQLYENANPDIVDIIGPYLFSTDKEDCYLGYIEQDKQWWESQNKYIYISGDPISNQFATTR